MEIRSSGSSVKSGDDACIEAGSTHTETRSICQISENFDDRIKKKEHLEGMEKTFDFSSRVERLKNWSTLQARIFTSISDQMVPWYVDSKCKAWAREVLHRLDWIERISPESARIFRFHVQQHFGSTDAQWVRISCSGIARTLMQMQALWKAHEGEEARAVREFGMRVVIKEPLAKIFLVPKKAVDAAFEETTPMSEEAWTALLLGQRGIFYWDADLLVKLILCEKYSSLYCSLDDVKLISYLSNRFQLLSYLEYYSCFEQELFRTIDKVIYIKELITFVYACRDSIEEFGVASRALFRDNSSTENLINTLCRMFSIYVSQIQRLVGLEEIAVGYRACLRAIDEVVEETTGLTLKQKCKFRKSLPEKVGRFLVGYLKCMGGIPSGFEIALIGKCLKHEKDLESLFLSKTLGLILCWLKEKPSQYIYPVIPGYGKCPLSTRMRQDLVCKSRADQKKLLQQSLGVFSDSERCFERCLAILERDLLGTLQEVDEFLHEVAATKNDANRVSTESDIIEEDNNAAYRGIQLRVRLLGICASWYEEAKTLRILLMFRKQAHAFTAFQLARFWNDMLHCYEVWWRGAPSVEGAVDLVGSELRSYLPGFINRARKEAIFANECVLDLESYFRAILSRANLERWYKDLRANQEAGRSYWLDFYRSGEDG